MHKIGKILPSTTALLLCDVQELFRPLMTEMPKIISTCQLLLKAAATLDIPVVATEQYPKAFKETLPELKAFCPQDQIYHAKTKFSMIDEFEKELAHENITSAVICGMETHICVQQTVLDLLEKGYDVHVVADGVTSQSMEDREVALLRMQHAGAHITTAEALVFGMCVDAKHPGFKDISKAVVERKKIEEEGL